MEGLLEEELTYRIRGCIYEVSRHLGAGFLEKVYERALLYELQSHGLHAQAQVPITVRYKGNIIGDYIADIVVEGKILLEVKATKQLHPAHETQLLNYLRATGLRIGLLINFTHPKAVVKRLII